MALIVSTTRNGQTKVNEVICEEGMGYDVKLSLWTYANVTLTPCWIWTKCKKWLGWIAKSFRDFIRILRLKRRSIQSEYIWKIEIYFEKWGSLYEKSDNILTNSVFSWVKTSSRVAVPRWKEWNTRIDLSIW